MYLKFIGLIPVLFLIQVHGAQIWANPRQINIDGNSPTSSLTISCRPSAPGIVNLLSLEIGKKDQFGANSPIIMMLRGDSQPTVEDTSYQQRMTQSGDISGSSGQIQIVLSDLRCTDAASYYCATTFTNPSVNSDEAVQNVTLRTYPRDIVMTVTPSRSQYSVGDLVEFNCNGFVGNSFTDVRNLWIWEWRYVGNQNTGWATYPYTENITYVQPSPAANCQFSSRTILSHYVGNVDNGRQFRCSAITSDNSGNKTIYVEMTVTKPSVGPTAPATGLVERNDLDCSGGLMHIHLPLSLFPTHSVTLRDPTCKVTSNGTHLTAEVGLNQCGTTCTMTNDTVVFSNELLATATGSQKANTIVDYGMSNGDVRVPVSCEFSRQGRLEFGYIPLQRKAHFYEKQYGHLEFEVNNFKTEQFQSVMANSGLPIGIPLNTEVFIELDLDQTNKKDLGIFIDSCIATPTQSPADPLWYPLIKDGCPMQADVRTFTVPDVNQFRFSFLAFKFTNAPLQQPSPSASPSPMVYLHCQVSACPTANCSTSCHAPSNRVKRSAEEQRSHLLSAGPFVLKDEEQHAPSYSVAVVIATMSVATVAVLVAMVAIVAWRRSVAKLKISVPPASVES